MRGRLKRNWCPILWSEDLAVERAVMGCSMRFRRCCCRQCCSAQGGDRAYRSLVRNGAARAGMERGRYGAGGALRPGNDAEPTWSLHRSVPTGRSRRSLPSADPCYSNAAAGPGDRDRDGRRERAATAVLRGAAMPRPGVHRWRGLCRKRARRFRREGVEKRARRSIDDPRAGQSGPFTLRAQARSWPQPRDAADRRHHPHGRAIEDIGGGP